MCGLLAAGAGTALADSAGQQINYHDPGVSYSITVGSSMLEQMKQEWIQKAEWKHNPEGWTLVVTPTDWTRKNFANPAAGDAGWAELYSKYKDKDRGIHKNINGMKDQFRCHVGFARDKATWDLDEWRPDVGYVRTVAEKCNPGGHGD
jgi:hypothetical protein